MPLRHQVPAFLFLRQAFMQTTACRDTVASHITTCMAIAGSLLASGLLPQRNGSEGGQMKLQLLRLPVASAGAIEELLMQFTSQVTTAKNA